jgi:putative transcriptional regulator
MVVHYGGPVETGRGFVLHTDDYRSSLHTMRIRGGYSMTATLDILEGIARGAGPERALMMLGYSGWGPGQLESEIAHNGWLTADASPQLVFQVPAVSKWSAALESLGVDPITLSGTAGHA